jgi:hypothetical protein
MSAKYNIRFYRLDFIWLQGIRPMIKAIAMRAKPLYGLLGFY